MCNASFRCPSDGSAGCWASIDRRSAWVAPRGADDEHARREDVIALAKQYGRYGYRVDPTKAPILFQKYRTDMDGIIAGPVRNAVRSALQERASRMTVEQIYGSQKTALINGALSDVQKYFEPLGLHIEQLYWASAVRIPETIMRQINAKIANEQQALAAQANVATVEADGRAKVAKAEADAKATEVEGAALRTNPEILQQRAIEKWDGKLPVYSGSGATPFIKLN